jgi:hypothetical protein
MDSDDIIQNYPKIYRRLDVPPNLKEHMIRVASVASIICDNWKGERINKDDVIAAALIHDVGNLVKFDFAGRTSNELLKKDPRDIGYWKRKQKALIKKYKTNDAQVVILAMMKEIGASKKIVRLLELCTPTNIKKILKSHNYEAMMLSYCDNRVGPFRIVSLKERFADLEKRYIGRFYQGEVITKKSFGYLKPLVLIEKELMRNARLSPEQINDRSVGPYVLRYKRKLGK